ncbi:MAG: PAS domain S-box protein [Candidatus Thermoplasmatota archaeon]|nr:PAS domain S-box protein [Candidatus Thermoplasmatota archaeon]
MAKRQRMKSDDVEQLLDYFPGFMAISDVEGHILAINKNLAKVFNKPRDALIGQNGFTLVDDQAGKRRRQCMQEAVRTKQPTQLVDRDKERWWKSLFVPILDASNKVVKLCFYIEDITKEKEREELTISMKDDYYKALIEHSSDLITLIDAQDKIVYTSPVISKLYGYKRSERINHPIFDNIEAHERSKLMNLKKKLLPKYGETKKIKLRVPHKDGSSRYLESIVTNQLNNPNIKGIIVNTRDITDLEEQRLQLLNQKNYLESLLDSTAEIIFTIKTGDQSIGMWNRAAELNTGVKHSEVRGKSLRALPLFENLPEIETYIQHVTAGKSRALSQIVIQVPHRGKRLWQVSPSFIEEHDEITEIICVCSDITYRSELHGKLIPGEVYLIPETPIDQAQSIFTSLLKEGWAGYYISRTDQDVQQFSHAPNLTVSTCATEKGTAPTISTLDELYHNIATFMKTHTNAVVLLDRLDYFVSLFSFQDTVKTLYRINDVIRARQGIFLLHINKLLFAHEQYAYFMEEFRNLPSQEIQHIQLQDDAHGILSYIMEQNVKNSIVTQAKICTHQHVSKVTAQKRLHELLRDGLIISKKQGRINALYLTEKGRELLLHQKIL